MKTIQAVAVVAVLAALAGCEPLALRAAGEASVALEARFKETVEARATERAERRATVREMVDALNFQARAAAEARELDGALEIWQRSLRLQDENATEFLIQKLFAERHESEKCQAPE